MDPPLVRQCSSFVRHCARACVPCLLSRGRPRVRHPYPCPLPLSTTHYTFPKTPPQTVADRTTPGLSCCCCRAVVTLSRMIRSAPCFRVPRVPVSRVSSVPSPVLPTYLLFLRTCSPTWDGRVSLSASVGGWSCSSVTFPVTYRVTAIVIVFFSFLSSVSPSAILVVS